MQAGMFEGKRKLGRLVGAAFALMLLAGCVHQPAPLPPCLGQACASLQGQTLDQPRRIVILADRTGGHRPGVFGRAIALANSLNPDIVLSVGDLIEGYTEDPAEIDRQWSELEGQVAALGAPLFAVPGNHDISNPAMAQVWQQRRGAPYWSLRAGDVLILGLSTEDPPIPLSPEAIERSAQLVASMQRDAEATQRALLERAAQREAEAGERVRLPGEVEISDAQVAFVRTALARNADAAWTLVLMHKPAWRYGSEQFGLIEQALADRPHTVIAGHEHYYEEESRNDREYYVLATSGGVWVRNGPGRFDHVMVAEFDGQGVPHFRNVKYGQGQDSGTERQEGQAQ